MKLKMLKEKCPKCKSQNVEANFLIYNDREVSDNTAEVKCQDCGHEGG